MENFSAQDAQTYFIVTDAFWMVAQALIAYVCARYAILLFRLYGSREFAPSVASVLLGILSAFFALASLMNLDLFFSSVSFPELRMERHNEKSIH